MKISSSMDVPQHSGNCLVRLSATHDGNNNVLVSTTVQDSCSTQHSPSAVVLVIDESGSMGAIAKMHDDSDGATGLVVMDIVKHASKTVLQTLSNTDSFAIVAFSTVARVALPLMELTPEHRQQAIEAIGSLQPLSSTNLYDGLIQALDLVGASQATTGAKNSNIMLLTDGMPNVSPPRGELESLQRYLDSHNDLSCSISTFGFGYSLKSRLLHDIAVLGKSQYSFIPDSSFVGTVFVNAIANVLGTALPPSILQVEASPGMTLSSSSPLAFAASWGLSVHIPPLLYGQSFQFLLKSEGESHNREPVRATLRLQDSEIEAEWHHDSDSRDQIAVAMARQALVDLLYECLEPSQAFDGTLFGAWKNETAEHIKLLKVTIGGDTTLLEGIEQDLTGQVSEALSRSDWYSRWGIHYLLSLVRAHVIQWCVNFKDPGPQFYATNKFAAIRDLAEELFVKLPPPKPSRKPRAAPLQSMHRYHNRCAPCFASGLVSMADGSRRDISTLKAGDWVMSPEGHARVVCVVETLCVGGVEALVDLGDGVRITPWHPVQSSSAGGAWRFPCDIAAPHFQDCRSVFSVVLEEGSAVRFGDHYAISLGHGRTDDPLLEHDYLGTEKVLRDLRTMEGWQTGHVMLGFSPIVRDKATNLVVGICQNA